MKILNSSKTRTKKNIHTKYFATKFLGLIVNFFVKTILTLQVGWLRVSTLDEFLPWKADNKSMEFPNKIPLRNKENISSPPPPIYDTPAFIHHYPFFEEIWYILTRITYLIRIFCITKKVKFT